MRLYSLVSPIWCSAHSSDARTTPPTPQSPSRVRPPPRVREGEGHERGRRRVPEVAFERRGPRPCPGAVRPREQNAHRVIVIDGDDHDRVARESPRLGPGHREPLCVRDHDDEPSPSRKGTPHPHARLSELPPP